MSLSCGLFTITLFARAKNWLIKRGLINYKTFKIWDCKLAFISSFYCIFARYLRLLASL